MLVTLSAPPSAAQDALQAACDREAADLHSDRRTCAMGYVRTDERLSVINATEGDLLLRTIEVFETSLVEAATIPPSEFAEFVGKIVVVAGELNGGVLYNARVLLPESSEVLRMAVKTWTVRVQGMGRICHVQDTTASPIGNDLSGPHGSRKVACEAAAALHDASFSDQSKCWGYGGGSVTGCAADGVTLP
jgi:hypothetical protein